MLALIPFLGCRDAVPPTEKQVGARFDDVRAVTGPASYASSDEEYAAVAEDVPGFGGMFYDSGVLTVYLKDTLIKAAARPRLERVLARRSGRRSLDALRFAHERAANFRVRRAKYDFRELLGYYRDHVVPVAMRSSGVISTDIDDRSNRIVVGVLNESFVEAVREALAALPVPRGAVNVEVVSGNVAQTAKARLRPMPPTTSCADNQLFERVCRPVPGGGHLKYLYLDSIGDCSVGTNVVAWVSGYYGSQRYFITSSHCGARGTVAPNYVMGQFSTSDSGGVEVIDPSWLGQDQLGSLCPAPKICRYSDAALFRYQNPAHTDQGHVALPAINSGTAFNSYVNITTIAVPVVGDTIYKIGATTGRQGGVITHDCVNATVTENGQPTNMWMLCQGVHTAWGLEGDSGGPVIKLLGGGDAALLGIHWGSAGAFSRIDYTLYELYHDGSSVGILDPRSSLASQPDEPTIGFSPSSLTVSISGTSTIHTEGSYSWTTSATGGTIYEYVWERKFQGGDWEPIEMGTSFQAYVTGPATYFDLRVTATSNNKTGTQTKRVNVTIQ